MMVIDMVSNNEMEKELVNAKQQTIDMANTSIETQKQMMETLNALLDKYADESREYMRYVVSDVIDSYNKLILLRKETIDKYIKLNGILFQDHKEFDVSIPTKSLMEKKYNDISNWQDEIKPLKLLMQLDENTSDEKADEVLDMLRNI